MKTLISKVVRHPWMALGLIFVLTFLAYSNVFHNPFFMDDYDFIVDWPLIQDWDNLPQFFFGYEPPSGQEGVYSPVKTLIHALNYHLFGLEPFRHHVFAFVNYLFSIVLVYLIGQFFLKDRAATFLCALLFAVHPVHNEYVMSLTGSVDAVGVNLMLLSFYLYIRAQRDEGGLDPARYLWSLFFALVSIYLHELCIILPVMFLLYDVCLRPGRGSVKNMSLRLLPFFLFSLSYVLAKYLVLGSITRGQYLYGSFYLTMLVTIKAWAKYVFISFFPVTLTFNHVISKGIYSFDPDDFDRVAVMTQSLFDLQVLVSLAVLGAIGYFAVRSFRKEPLVTFCIGWFFLGLLPGSNIVPSGIYFAERYLYAGSLGFCLLFGYYGNKLFHSDKRVWKVRTPIIVSVLVALITVLCVARIWSRNREAHTEVSLYESAVRANPTSALMRTDLGIVYLRYQMPEKAVDSFQESLKIRSDDPVTYFTMAEAYLQTNKTLEAKEALEKAIDIDPEYADAYYNLAGLSVVMGDAPAGKRYFERAMHYFRQKEGSEKADQYEKEFKDFFRGIN